jgi:polar amino acid transport system permease protein
MMLSRIRPSNLVILFALPFIVLLFATSTDYSRSLAAIVGVEQGSSAYLPGFLLCLCAFLSALAATRWLVWPKSSADRRRALIVSAVWAVLAAILVFTDLAIPYIASVVANSVDGFTSELVVRGETPRRLTDAALASTEQVARTAFLAYCVLTAAGIGILLMTVTARARRAVAMALLGLNGAGLAYVLLFAYVGFAAGVAITVRAAIMAYVLAVLLGLFWIGLLQLRLVRRSVPLFTGLALLALATAAWNFTQPKEEFVIVGTLAGKVAVTPGTPQALIDVVRFGQFPGADAPEVPVKTMKDPDAAIAAIALGQDVSAALVPIDRMQPGQKPLWQTSALPDGTKNAGIAFLVLGLVIGLLTLGGFLHLRHPLSVGAEFIIDTIRGIPMLVIVLYIGLPLSGAIKESTGGFIDPPNLARGITAMALAYSAYLAEIFRSGINAVPVGQLEAARSLGLTRWQTARHVVIPQAFRIVIPPLGNEFIAILKDTSLLSILSIRDVTQRMREFQSASFLPFAPYNSAAIFYLLLTLVAASLIASIERKYDVKHR